VVGRHGGKSTRIDLLISLKEACWWIMALAVIPMS
jgi:hypothetical protein